MSAPPRTHTPDRATVNDEGRTVTTFRIKRACNGCGQLLGDANDMEIAAALLGQELPDVRDECPTCTPETH